MTHQEAKILLESQNQSHLLAHWDKLGVGERQSLLSQIEKLDFKAIQRMVRLLHEGVTGNEAQKAEPFPAPVSRLVGGELQAAFDRGVQALDSGRVGVILVAGGQGSRLGFDGPKGAYPIGPVSDAVLFYFHARKIAALSRTHGHAVPLYIMTSQSNDQTTRDCFAENDFFGLKVDQVFFFKQGMWPALNSEGALILNAPDRLFMSPDGHGGTLSALKDSGALDDMRRRGIETLFYFQVDNPLVEVADPAFIGLHLLQQAEISLKVCAKRDPQEGLGMVVQRNGRTEIIEYTELTEEQKNRRVESGELYFLYGSVAIHVFQLDFLERMASIDLPLHVAHKQIPYCDSHGSTIHPAEPNGYKFEKFIFDLVPMAEKVVNLIFERSEEFSPVKNAVGNDSPESCKRDLSAKWARWLRQAGISIDIDRQGRSPVPVEIDPLFANSPAELKGKLKGLAVDTSKAILLK